MIGHLQRNKVRRILPVVEMVQSVDSPQLAAAIERISAELSRSTPILLEVNVSDESAKHGFTLASVEPFLEQLAGYRHVKVAGLMCMAGLHGGPDEARRDFAKLRELRDRLRPKCPDGIELDELSMGMSSDFEEAIGEGATIVRVGSLLFEGAL